LFNYSLNFGIMADSDPTTQSNYLEISTQHVALDWHVDFTLKVISGSATHDLIVRKDGIEAVM
jgi:leukotriene-A4 hydrolase